MINLLLVIVLGSWYFGGTPASTTPRNHEAVYAKGHAELVEVMKIGGGPDESEDAPPFYQPIDLDIGPDGTIYVLDSETKELVAFDRNGTMKFRSGRSGEGPGELRDAFNLSVDHLGRVVVYDEGNRRFSLFDPRGKFIRSSRYDETVVDFECRPDGRLVVLTESTAHSQLPPGTLVSLSLLDSTLATTAVLDSLRIQKWITVRTAEGVSMVSQPYYHELHWCSGPDGRLYVARSGEYEIRVLDKTLAPVRTLQRSVPAVKVTGEDRAPYFEDRSPAVIGAMKFPDHKPPLRGLQCDPRGYLLVRRAVASAAQPLFDVYRPDGSFVAELTVPGLKRAPAFDGDTLLLRVFSDEELPAVIRYRLE